MRLYEPLAFAPLVALVAAVPVPFSEDGRSFSLDQYADQTLHTINVWETEVAVVITAPLSDRCEPIADPEL